MSQSVHSETTVKFRDGSHHAEVDLLVVEEPLEIRLGYGPHGERQQYTVTVTMRTPGHDEELCVGFLFAEGIIEKREDVLSAKYCGSHEYPDEKFNVMRVELHPEAKVDTNLVGRNFYTTSSCGVCGKASMESLAVACQSLTHVTFAIEASMLSTLPKKLTAAQNVFEHTGGLHAAGLFDVKGNVIILREDVGRHNALDKLIGASLLNQQVPCSDTILMLSGRISFDLVQKAIRAGISTVAAVGAPSSLAVEVAKSFGVTLIGFLKQHKFNIYCGEERIIF